MQARIRRVKFLLRNIFLDRSIKEVLNLFEEDIKFRNAVANYPGSSGISKLDPLKWELIKLREERIRSISEKKLQV